MIIDLAQYVLELRKHDIKIMQKDICRISGVNRYTISMAMSDKRESKMGLYNAKADVAYRLHKAYPFALELPDDFFRYSSASLRATLDITSKKMADIKRETGILPVELAKNKDKKNAFFIYDKREVFRAFETIYIPIKNGEYADAFPEATDHQVICERIAKKKKAKPATREDFIINMAMQRIKKSEADTLLEYVEKIHAPVSAEVAYGFILSALNDVYSYKKEENLPIDMSKYNNKV